MYVCMYVCMYMYVYVCIYIYIYMFSFSYLQFAFVSLLAAAPGIRLYYTILYYTILYYTILYYTILYYTIMYYAILYSIYYLVYCVYGQFSKFHVCCFGLDSGNLKFETVRTNKQHICC